MPGPSRVSDYPAKESSSTSADSVVGYSTESLERGERNRALRILAASALAQGTEAYCVQGIPVLLPFIVESIPLSAVQVGALASAPYVANLLFCLALGQALERWGSKAVISAGLLVIGAGMFVCSVADSYWQMYFGLIITGIGFTSVYPGTSKAVMENTPARLRGTFMGLKQMGVTLGAALGAAVLPVAALRWSWQASLGCVGAMATITALIWKWMYGPDRGGGTSIHNASQARQTYSLIGFLRRYGANKILWLVNLTAMGLMILQTTSSIWLPTYLKQGLDWDPVSAGRVLACLQIGGALGRGSLGALSDAIGGNRAAVAGTCSIAAAGCLLLLSSASSGTGFGLLSVLALLIGYFAVGWVGVVTVMRAELIPDEIGMVTSFGLFFMALGSVLGPPMFGWLTADSTTFRVAWMWLASVGVVTTAMAASAGYQSKAHAGEGGEH